MDARSVPRPVIVAYRPLAGQAARLEALVAGHHAALRAEGLVTERLPWRLRAADGTLVEVFEWASAEAIERAHANPVVLALWERFDACCTYVPLAALPEAAGPFAEFDALA